MIPKKIHYCWFGGKPLNKLGKNVLKVGKSIFLITRLLNGMKAILILIAVSM